MTLTDLSYYIRKFLPLIIIIVLFVIVFIYAVGYFFSYLQSQQTVSIYTNPIFGKIRAPLLKEASTSSKLKYTLDTIEGRPTTATQAADIYFLPAATTKFGYREKIYLMAKTIGFATTLINYTLADKTATFKDSIQQLEIDITNFNFSYKYDFVNNDGIFSTATSPQKDPSIGHAIDFLNSVGRYPEELSKGKTNVILYSYNKDDKTYKIVDREIDANMIEVDFYRPDVGDYPIVSPTYFNSQNYVVMVFNQSGYKIVKAQVNFFEKSETQIGTYLIKSGDSAWNDLNKGKGWIINNPEGTTNVVVRKMFLGYFDPDIYQEYLQPVYVFLGDKNFVGYVSAVDSTYMTGQ